MCSKVTVSHPDAHTYLTLPHNLSISRTFSQFIITSGKYLIERHHKGLDGGVGSLWLGWAQYSCRTALPGEVLERLYVPHRRHSTAFFRTCPGLHLADCIYLTLDHSHTLGQAGEVPKRRHVPHPLRPLTA